VDAYERRIAKRHPARPLNVNSEADVFRRTSRPSPTRSTPTSNVDESCWKSSADICTLFNADRLDDLLPWASDKQTIVSKVKTGLNSFKDLKLPIAEHSIGGYVGLSKRMLQPEDVYDEGELKSHTRICASCRK